jgi:hypothetical protein
MKVLARSPRLSCSPSVRPERILALLCLCGSAGYAQVRYGHWVSIGAGQMIESEGIRVHPLDPNVVIAVNDAAGVGLTCDGARSWYLVNKGLIGGVTDPKGRVLYFNGRPESATAWDPIDPNYVYTVHASTFFRGRLCRIPRPGILWTCLAGLPQPHAWDVAQIAFDPDPDPNGTGRAQVFYALDQFGHIAFTRDGGLHLYPVAPVPSTHIPGPVEHWAAVPGQHARTLYTTCRENSYLAVSRVNTGRGRAGRLLRLACPGWPLYVYGYHNQDDPADPNNTKYDANHPDDPDRNLWRTDENAGLPDPNDPNVSTDPTWIARHPGDLNFVWIGANGIIPVHPASGDYPLVLACKRYGNQRIGGVYTKASRSGRWVLREKSVNPDPNHSFSGRGKNAIEALTLDPIDPNIAYVIKPRDQASMPPSGVVCTTNLFARDPNDTIWSTLTRIDPRNPNNPDPAVNNMKLAYIGYTSVHDGFTLCLARSDPNIIYYSNNRLGLFKTINRGATWEACFADGLGHGYWRGRGFNEAHVQSVLLDPVDPNVIYIGGSDFGGHYKSRDRGRTLKMYFNGYGYGFWSGDPDMGQWCAAPKEVTYTYREGGSTVVSYRKKMEWFASHARGTYDPNFYLNSIEQDVVSGVFDPRDPNRMVLVLNEGNSSAMVAKTSDGCENMTFVFPDPRGPGDPRRADPNYTPLKKDEIFEVACDPGFGTFFIAAGHDGVFKSTDGADSWSKCLEPTALNLLPPGHPTPANDPEYWMFNCVDVSKADPQIVFCASGQTRGHPRRDGYVYRSTDAGSTWRRITSTPYGISDLELDPADANVAYFAAMDSGGWRPPYTGGVYRSLNALAPSPTWARIFPPNPNPRAQTVCTHVKLHPHSPGTLCCLVDEYYVAAASTPPGLYVKVGDKPWVTEAREMNSPYPTALPDLATRYYSLSIHPVTGEIYVGTSAGAFRRD